MTKANQSLNRQHIVACLWDFDKTLSPDYMQKPLFEYYGIDEGKFWSEVNGLPNYYAKRGVRMLPEIAYLDHMLTYARHGIMKGLTNDKLREIGKNVELCPGLPDAFTKLKEFVAKSFGEHGIKLEHYVLSTGLKPMIEGCAMAKVVDGIFASEFLEESAPPHYLEQPDLPMTLQGESISQIAAFMDNTSKTRVIFEINKGCNKNNHIDVNSSMEENDRRVPLPNMIYVADGPSDVPAFSIMRQSGGRALAVYNPDRPEEFKQTDALLQNRRVNFAAPTDYRETSSTYQWLKMHIEQICTRIISSEDTLLSSKVGAAPKHMTSSSNALAKSDSQTTLL